MTTQTTNVNTGDQLSNVKFSSGGSSSTPAATGEFDEVVVRLRKNAGSNIVPGSVQFSFDGNVFFDRAGRVVKDIDTATGSAVDVGQADYLNGEFHIPNWSGATPTVTLLSAVEQWSDATVSGLTFRTPIAPVRPGSVSITATRVSDGAIITGTFNNDGVLDTAAMVGKINYETGVFRVWFRKTSGDATAEGIDITIYAIPGETIIYPVNVYASTLRFNAVGYTYIPLDADLIGIDPVRLPSDGRVPVFRKGDLVVFTNKATHTQTVSNGQTVDLGRERISRVRLLGANGVRIDAGFTYDLDAGEVTFTDVTGYSQPVTIEDWIEDMVLLSDVQINGQIAFTRPLTHDFDAGDTYVAGVLAFGDLRARVPLLFDQATWTNVWSDELIGSGALASYNDINYPLVVTNAGALTERWVIIFTNSTSFTLTGEHLGQIAVGNVTTDLAPINPNTGEPYFTIDATGWGSGWSTGNAVRFNTVGAVRPVWLVQTVQQGPATVDSDGFRTAIRGNIDN